MNKAERKQALNLMQMASHEFYKAAVSIGVHPFIEFTGLMNEYITICRMAEKNNKEWVHASTHSGVPLRMHEHSVKYLAEKLDCIYGPTLRAHPEMMKALLGQAEP